MPPLIFALLVIMLASTNVHAQVLTRADLQEKPGSEHDEQVLQCTIEVDQTTQLPASIEVSSKGNGVLRIANLELKVYDDHDNGVVFKDAMGHIEFADLNDDGAKDLIIFGEVQYTAEDGPPRILREEQYLFIYTYDKVSRGFRRTYAKADFKLEL